MLDVAGDLKLRCVGTGRVQQQETDKGTVYRCAGRQGGQVVMLGSHFVFRGFAKRYRALFPAGAAGSFHGRFVTCRPDAEAAACGPKPDAEQTDPKQRGERPQAPADDDEIPSLDELAAMLDG